MVFTELEINASLSLLEPTQYAQITPPMITNLTHYLNCLMQWNKAYNLTAITEKNNILIKHLLDSLVIRPFITHQHVIDVGSGAGLPGLLLAIVCPQTHFHLLDSANKRTRFMQQMVLEMKLPNVTVIQSRVQDFKPEIGFDLVLSRAFATLSDMLKWSQHLVHSEGKFLAMKGKCDASEIKALEKEAPNIKILEIHPLQVPHLNEERHLVIMQHLILPQPTL